MTRKSLSHGCLCCIKFKSAAIPVASFHTSFREGSRERNRQQRRRSTNEPEHARLLNFGFNIHFMQHSITLPQEMMADLIRNLALNLTRAELFNFKQLNI